MKIKRYQECNLLEKLYRRLKYQPYYFIKAVYYFIKYMFVKSEYKPSFYFQIMYSDWQSKAEWWYTLKELKSKRRAKWKS